MASDSDSIQPPDEDPTSHKVGSIAERTLQDIEHEFEILREQAQQLLSEKLDMENKVAKQKQKVKRLEEEVRLMRMPPHVVGNIQDVLDDERAVVRSSNGTVFLVTYNRGIDAELMKPGARVALNQDTLSIIDVLHDAWDPLVMGAEMLEKPITTFSDLGGLDEQISLIKESIELPLIKPESFLNFGIEPPAGVILVGPPGCGKTMLAKAVANSTDCTFIRLVASELAQKYIGEGGRMVRELFDLARERSPSIVFIDEIDAIGAKRLDSATSGDREVQRTLMQLLAELDGFDSLCDVKFIAATNRPDILDEALLRPGRFDRVIEIPIPNEEARASILNIHMGKMPITKGVSIDNLVLGTEGFSGAELKALTVEAGMCAIRNDRKKATKADFAAALKSVIKKRAEKRGEAPNSLWS
ncbi:MAG: proteasome-activating nucleotidase [Candidatus Thalassarchaeaceae archaeon]|jgi:proteasome regulatory subunit|nr:proteasome-activating nucleotidase [Candidatus Thalassarchaeaceae archaeon]MDP7042624.1 proteasome-activating nucleotidase [Candidatus Thalassarchaeaceae archaeon]